MFLPIGDSVLLFVSFIIIGFVMGMCYEILRIARLCFHTHRIVVDIQDILFFSLSAAVCFVFSMELSDGTFRLYFVLGAIIGGAVYFLTLGRLISFVSQKIVRLIKRLFAKPIAKVKKLFGTFFYKIRQKIVNVYRISIRRVIIHLKGLHFNHKTVYNKQARQDNTLSDSDEKRSDKRNVIHATVSKKT